MISGRGSQLAWWCAGLEGGADAVRAVVEKAAYMVLGLGDVYLGAPCAVPVDPRSAAGFSWEAQVLYVP